MVLKFIGFVPPISTTFLFWQMIFRCEIILCLLIQVTWWSFDLFPLFGCHKSCCCEYLRISFCVGVRFHLFSWVDRYLGWNCCVMWWHCVYHFEDLLDCLPKWLHHFTFPSTVCEVPTSPHPCLPRLALFVHLISILVGVKYLPVALAFPWWVSSSIFSWAYWPLVFILWRNVCSHYLSIIYALFVFLLLPFIFYCCPISFLKCI